MQSLMTLKSAMKNYLQLCQIEATGEILLSTLISAESEGRSIIIGVLFSISDTLVGVYNCSFLVFAL